MVIVLLGEISESRSHTEREERRSLSHTHTQSTTRRHVPAHSAHTAFSIHLKAQGETTV